jgi:flagellar biosynthesis/type III secretory pathway protein FliH
VGAAFHGILAWPGSRPLKGITEGAEQIVREGTEEAAEEGTERGARESAEQGGKTRPVLAAEVGTRH